MSGEPTGPDLVAAFVRKVSQETGITEEQVREIISLVGYNYPSIIREARLLKGSEK